MKGLSLRFRTASVFRRVNTAKQKVKLLSGGGLAKGRLSRNTFQAHKNRCESLLLLSLIEWVQCVLYDPRSLFEFLSYGLGTSPLTVGLYIPFLTPSLIQTESDPGHQESSSKRQPYPHTSRWVSVNRRLSWVFSSFATRNGLVLSNCLNCKMSGQFSELTGRTYEKDESSAAALCQVSV